MQRFANPTRFMNFSSRVLPWLAAATLALAAVGLWRAYHAPPDYQQGESVRIMFIHVPSAWLAMMVYSIITLSSIGFLVWRHPLADVAAKAAAPLGAAFTALALVTGSLWGRPTWGTYWEWDARITSVLILFLMYLGLIALRNALEDEQMGAKLTAVLAIVGSLILPVIKFSVDWWHTLHQPASVLRIDGARIHASLLEPLLIMALAFTLLFFTLHFAAMRNEIMRRRIAAYQRARVTQGGTSQARVSASPQQASSS